MKYRSEQRNIFVLDCIMFVISIISLCVFTGFYLLIDNDARNVLLLFDIYGITTLVESVKGVTSYWDANKIKKCSRKRVNPKLFYSRSRGVEKTI